MIIGIMVLVFPGKWMVVAYGSAVAWVSQNKLETGFKPNDIICILSTAILES